MLSVRWNTLIRNLLPLPPPDVSTFWAYLMFSYLDQLLINIFSCHNRNRLKAFQYTAVYFNVSLDYSLNSDTKWILKSKNSIGFLLLLILLWRQKNSELVTYTEQSQSLNRQCQKSILYIMMVRNNKTNQSITERHLWLIKSILSNSGPDHLQVNSRCLSGPFQLNLYLRFRRSGPE